MLIKDLLAMLKEEQEPEIEEYDGEDVRELVKQGLAKDAFYVSTRLRGGAYADHLHGYWLYNSATDKTVVGTVIEPTGEYNNAMPYLYDMKVTASQAANWYRAKGKIMKLDPNEYYHFTFTDAEGNSVPGGYERSSAALAYAKENHLQALVLVGGSLVVVPDQSKI